MYMHTIVWWSSPMHYDAYLMLMMHKHGILRWRWCIFDDDDLYPMIIMHTLWWWCMTMHALCSMKAEQNYLFSNCVWCGVQWYVDEKIDQTWLAVLTWHGWWVDDHRLMRICDEKPCWAEWLDIDEHCWPAEWYAIIDVQSIGWLCNRAIWFLARIILHLRIGLLKPFLVGAKKTRLGPIMIFGVVFISWCWL